MWNESEFLHQVSNEHRKKFLSVTRDELVDVAERYLVKVFEGSAVKSVVIGRTDAAPKTDDCLLKNIESIESNKRVRAIYSDFETITKDGPNASDLICASETPALFKLSITLVMKPFPPQV